MYTMSVPIFKRMLNNLSAVLDKAVAHIEARKIEPAALLAYRFYPDMLPFTKQIQIACDMAKGCAARLGGIEVPKYDDNESSFSQLQARIQKTIAFIDSVDRQSIEASAEKEIVFPIRGSTVQLSGHDYLTKNVLPNFYFHATVTYAILRHNGVELGKRDFIGQL
jgi:hypothetical protein